MNTRHLLATGIVLVVLTSGCSRLRKSDVASNANAPVTTTGAAASREPAPGTADGKAATGPLTERQDRARALADRFNRMPQPVPVGQADTEQEPAPKRAPHDADARAASGAAADPGRFRVEPKHVPAAPVAPARVAPEPAPAPAMEGNAVATNQQATMTPGPIGPARISPHPLAPVNEDPKFVTPSARVDVSMSMQSEDMLIRRITKRAKDNPREPAAQLDYQIAMMLLGEKAPVMEQMGQLPLEQREMIAALIDGISMFRNGAEQDPSMLPSRLVKPLLEMSSRFRNAAELNIPTLALCSRVSGFGVYEPMPGRFKAGVDNPVILYSEVANFASRQNEQQLWETKLSQEAVLYMESGYPAWRDRCEIPPDLSRNKRHDFYVVRRAMLPRTLPVGRYILKVTITDELVHRVAEQTMAVELIAQ